MTINMRSSAFKSSRVVPTRDAYKTGAHFFYSKSKDGFSILELVAVVTVIGALSSLTIPKISELLTYSKIDEAKAILNSAAADCLQSYRMDPENAEKVDVTIISDERLRSTGYSVNKEKSLCSKLELIPTDPNDPIRFPFGFSVIKGQLLKTATPTSAASISACEAWAGVDCAKGTDLANHIIYLEKIEAKKTSCNANYNKWLAGGTQTASFKKWDPKADSRCPTRPPITDSSKCNSNGCDPGITVWGLDGEYVGRSREDYERALEKKYGQACTEWIAEKKVLKYTNRPQNIPATLDECKGQEFWFYKGVDVGSKTEFDKRICGDNLEREKQTPGKRTVQGCGDKIYYFSEDKIHDSEREYKESSCKVDKYNRAQKGKNGAFSTTETGAEGCGDFWVCSNQIINNKESYDSQCGKSAAAAPPQKSCKSPTSTCNKSKFYTHPICINYSRCMGRI